MARHLDHDAPAGPHEPRSGALLLVKHSPSWRRLAAVSDTGREADTEARRREALRRFRADCGTLTGGLEELRRMRDAEIESDDRADAEALRGTSPREPVAAEL